MSRLREWARRLKGDIVALWFCTRHPRTPFAAKALAVALVAYAFSPIDLVIAVWLAALWLGWRWAQTWSAY